MFFSKKIDPALFTADGGKNASTFNKLSTKIIYGNTIISLCSRFTCVIKKEKYEINILSFSNLCCICSFCR